MSQMLPAIDFSAGVRHVMIDGEPWFSAKDVLKALDVKGDTSRQLDKLDTEMKRVLRRREVSPEYGETSAHLFAGSAPSATIISEAGVYLLINRSDKPEAHRLQSYMANVAVSLRKRGSFTVGQEALSEAGKDALAAAAHRQVGLIAAEEREARSLAFDVLKGRKRSGWHR